MKRMLQFILPLLAAVITANTAIGQISDLFDDTYPRVDIVSGYGRTLYKLDGYTQTGYVPVSGRFMMEFGDYFEGGAELKMHILAPTFALQHPFTENEGFTEKYRFGYVGGAVRFYPAYGNRYFFTRIGLGWNFLNRKDTKYSQSYLETEKYLEDEEEKTSYTDPFGFNLGVGTYLGDDFRFVAALIYHFKMNTLETDKDERYLASALGLQLGFSIPLY